MQINAYLKFDGRCAEAFKFYERCFRGQIEMMTHGESPSAGETPASWKDNVMHARLVVGDAVLMGCDEPPDSFAKPAGFSVSIGVTDPAEAERIFAELAQGGTVQLPLQQTFWAVRFGMLVDRFGIAWMVNCENAQG